MSNILRDKQGIFSAFDRFKAEVMQGLAREKIEIIDLIPFYKAMEPALHSKVLDTEIIDFNALDYAVKRLPCNVTENFIYVLIDELYEHFSEPWKLFSPVPAEARRRRGWKMLPGQTMMLYRPGITDVLDLITCLCVLTVEAEKIRRRLSDYKLILMLKSYLNSETDSSREEKKLFNYLPFDKNEIEGLKIIWPENTAEQLFKITTHSGIFSLIIKKQVDLYNTRRSEMWLSQIGDAAKNLPDTVQLIFLIISKFILSAVIHIQFLTVLILSFLKALMQLLTGDRNQGILHLMRNGTTGMTLCMPL